MGCASSTLSEEQLAQFAQQSQQAQQAQQEQLQAVRRRRVKYCRDLSRRDPLLACMALVSAAEQAHVGGFRTLPLTPMTMHYVNTAATENDAEVASVSLDPYPNWWRNITWSDGVSASSGNVTATQHKGSLCWRRLRVTYPHDLRQLASRAPKLTELEVNGFSGSIDDFPTFHHLIRLCINTGFIFYESTRRVKIGAHSHRVHRKVITGVNLNLQTLWQSVPALTRLECCYQTADLSALAMLPQLRFLKLHYLPNLTNAGADAISKCTRLQELILSDCPVTDVSSISACRELQHLDAVDVQNCGLMVASTAVAVCSAVPTCRKLALHNPTFDDMRRLSQLERSIDVTLCVTNNALTRTDLVTIDSQGNGSLRPELLNPSDSLLKITKLKLFFADRGDRSVDVTPLTALPALTHLTVEVLGVERGVAVTGSLQGARALKYLQISNAVETAFADGLFAVRTLEELHLSQCQYLCTVSRLDECPAIRVAYFYNCGFSHLALREMCLAWNRLKDLRLTACLNVTNEFGLELSELLLDGVVHVPHLEALGTGRYTSPTDALCRTWYRRVEDARSHAM